MIISAKAQQCGNCKEIPTIAGFGFDIQVKQPIKKKALRIFGPNGKISSCSHQSFQYKFRIMKVAV
jgi:hypothetical protein